MNIRNVLEKLLKEAVQELGYNFNGEIKLEHPQDLKNGDFTTNLAMQIAGKEAKNPREIADQFRAKISKKDIPEIEKVEVAGPGYLNFYLSKEFFKEFLEQNLASPNFAPQNQNKKILLEHSSPNLFKPFHIGHLVNNSIGESLNRILDYQGYEVKQVSFPSDVSPGIAKTIWALKKEEKEVENLTLKEIADAYVLGTKEYKENEEVKKEIDEINQKIYNYLNGEKISDLDIEFYEKGKKLSLEHFKEITNILGSNFEEIIFESEAEKLGKEIVKNNLEKVFQKGENGAIIFEGKNFTNVFINSAGFGTYLAKDTGLLKIKKEKYNEVEKSLVVTDIEQKQHFEMVKEAGEQIPEISDFVKKSEYLQHGRMTFSGKEKISSRYGNVPLATEVIEKVKENILEKMKEAEFYGGEKEKQETAEKIAIATLKYSILKVSSGKNISFDLEKDLNPQGNTASFILYSLVRIKSIFREKNNNLDAVYSSERSGDIPEVERILYQFSEVVEKSEKDYSAHHLANYLFELAQKFNSFYAETKILDKENPDFNYNFAMLGVIEKTLEKGLYLLGIKSVEKM